MAYTSGTATDYHDALSKLRTFLSATLGWTEVDWTAPATITDNALLISQPIGTGSYRPYVYIRTQADVGAGLYHWRTSMSTAYDSGTADPLAQVGSSNGLFTALSNSSVGYWFYGNDRRIICVFKVGTVYSYMYAGLYLPYALPSEFRRPLYVAGTNYAPALINESNNRNSYLASPGYQGAQVMNMSDVWDFCHNHPDDSTPVFPQFLANTGSSFLWPKKCAVTSYNVQNSSYSSFQYYSDLYMRPNGNGEVPVTQCQIVSSAENIGLGAVLGALDGVYSIPGFGLTSEQAVTVGGTTYRVFQNCDRTTYADFMAIEEA